MCFRSTFCLHRLGRRGPHCISDVYLSDETRYPPVYRFRVLWDYSCFLKSNSSVLYSRSLLEIGTGIDVESVLEICEWRSEIRGIFSHLAKCRASQRACVVPARAAAAWPPQTHRPTLQDRTFMFYTSYTCLRSDFTSNR